MKAKSSKTLKSRKSNVITIHNNENGKTKKYRYKEIPVNGTDYSKLVNQKNEVAVLYSSGYGSPYSAYLENKKLQQKAIMDSRIVKYVCSEEYQKSKYDNTKNQAFLKQIFGNDYKLMYEGVDIGSDISVAFIPIGKSFRIDEYDGRETIKIFNPYEYFVA